MTEEEPLKSKFDSATQAVFNPLLEEQICTLYEGRHHYGLAAFLNSLVHKGYNGRVWVGYRGNLPPWIHQLQAQAPREAGGDTTPCFMLAGQICVHFVPVNPPVHMANFKPDFMLLIFKHYAPECSYLWYFDSDIFLFYFWKYFSFWQRCGVALCADINYRVLDDNSPMRGHWKQFAREIGLGQSRPLNQHFNSGLLCVARDQISFLELWSRILTEIGLHGYDLCSFMPGSRELPFYAIDQDALNITAMYSEHALSPLGRSGMGFETGGAVLYHTVGAKPWNGTLKRALNGHPPTSGIRYYFTQVDGPIKPYTWPGLRMRKFACSLSNFIGRFYMRPHI
jgi:hypothetical protein